ncbi:MAG: aminodeoxychorismate/anthranilate synthase component II [Cyclobacteriaceae bacterium]|jgi:anthranilate synthase component 2|nr:aminodeoxychorismate/anthranilate synthase component II [Cyclobacteriaceae bacterium]
MKILVFDNYDSFTYNLVHIIRELGYTPDVFRNDEITLEEINQYDKILLSPGPGIPDEAGILKPLIQQYADKKSILGVCLGHQAIAEVFGAKLYNIKNVLHGVTSQAKVIIQDVVLFQHVSNKFQATHYHSWAVSDENFPEVLEVTATNDDKIIMALRHKNFDVRGVQFHPESIMTPEGKQMIKNWINHNKK